MRRLVPCFFGILLLLVSHAGSADAKTLNVQVRSAQVKASPNYLSATVGTLSLGATVQIAGQEGNWYRIASPSGYLPKTTLGSERVSIDTSKQYSSGGAARDEVALAGKGFNPQVEQQYRRQNASLSSAYQRVDQVERMTVSNSALMSFITSGQLQR